MAQIGSPSAGWYTDPSGRHRARYWDGASWTEQVRDDLTAPAEPSAGSAAPAAPTAHPAAATVAGVAEAVAAVAANDVAPPAATPEPPLVVDYGSPEPWGGVGGNGAVPVGHDPFAPAASPTPDAAGAPAMPVAEPVMSITEPAVVPAAVEEPFAPVAPVASGPAPGWYPDPAARHEARLWDGTAWTARVADHGVEGVDPLPGAAATTTDPATDPTGTAAFPVSDAAAAGAAPASLTELPEKAEPEPRAEKPEVRPSLKVRVAGGFALGGALALLLGSLMTWMEVTGPRVGDASSSSGVDLGDGRITVALAVVLAVLGGAILTGRMGRFGGTKVAAMGALVAGAAALALTAVDIADVADRASRLGVPAGAVANVGTGLWLAFVGALFAVAGGLMAFANRQ